MGASGTKPPGKNPAASFEGRSFRHELAMVMTPACDLEQDFRIRFAEQQGHPQPSPDAEDHPNLISHVLVCDVYREASLRLPGVPEILKETAETHQSEPRRAIPPPLISTYRRAPTR